MKKPLSMLQRALQQSATVPEVLIKPERSDVELLQLLLDNINSIDMFRTGLCILSAYLLSKDQITPMEHSRITHIIHEHKPKHLCRSQAYYWPQGEIAPRLEFLNQLIKQLS